ncbi:MAG: VOC family protein [Polyangiaceae bacterium]
MTTPPIVPCIWFDDQAEAAAEFYVRVFSVGRITDVSRYPEGSESNTGRPAGSVLTVAFEIFGQRMTGLNGGPMFVLNPSVSFFAEVPDAAEADRLFAALSDGGKALMPIGAYPWSERYGWVQDRFGVSWQVMVPMEKLSSPRVVPCLMFSGKVFARADEAMKTFTGIFPDSRIGTVERYAEGEGAKAAEGTVKHGRFFLGAQPMVAMDSHVEHGFAFNEALSFQVMCADQADVDRYSAALSEGGEVGPCGWLKDRFGVSWQIVPEGMPKWLTGGDAASRKRVFEAMMGMKKLDIQALEEAFSTPR